MYPRKNIVLYPINCVDYLEDGFIDDALDEYKLLLKVIKNKIPPISYCNLLDDDMYHQLIIGWQHTTVISHAYDKYPIVGTYGLNSCVSLILYEPNYKIAIVTHFDGLPGWSKRTHELRGTKLNFDPLFENVNSAVENVYKILNKSFNEKLKFDTYIIGGIYKMSEITVVDIYNLINDKYINVSFNIKGRNLFGHDNQKRNVAIDTRTGKLYQFINRIIETKTGKKPNMIPLDLEKENGFILKLMYLPRYLNQKN